MFCKRKTGPPHEGPVFATAFIQAQTQKSKHTGIIDIYDIRVVYFCRKSRIFKKSKKRTYLDAATLDNLRSYIRPCVYNECT